MSHVQECFIGCLSSTQILLDPPECGKLLYGTCTRIWLLWAEVKQLLIMNELAPAKTKPGVREKIKLL